MRVVCRVRPLNEKEKCTSSFVVKFPAENSVGIAVRMCYKLMSICNNNIIG